MMHNLNNPKLGNPARFMLSASVSPGRYVPAGEASQLQAASTKARDMNERIRHRRMASLSKAKPSAKLVQGANYSLLQKYCRGARTEKPTPLVSPRVSTMKSLILTEIYTSKPLGKSTSHHPPALGTTTIIKSGRMLEEVRHGSTGSRRPSYASSRRRSKENVVTPKNPSKDAEDAKQLVQEGVEALKCHDPRAALDRLSRAALLCPNNPDVYFNRGLAHLEANEPAKAIKVSPRTVEDEQDMLKLVDDWPKYNRSAYLYLSVAYTKTLDTASAISTLSRAIVLDHSFAEAYLARGQLLCERLKWQQALQDFCMVQTLSPDLALGYLSAGECYAALDDYSKAIGSFSRALELDPEVKGKVLMKRSEMYYKRKDMDQALADVTRYLEEVDKYSVDALLLLGKVQRRKGMTNDSLINFEQVIKYDKEGAQAVNAIIKIAKIRLKQKDFYGAHHTLQRPGVLKIPVADPHKLDNYLTLTEAVQYLMHDQSQVLYLIKRKAKMAVKLLSSLVVKNDSLSKYIRAQCRIYRGYGYMAMHEFDNALNDYTETMKYKRLGKSSHFNMLVCEAVREIDKRRYRQAVERIDRALELFPGNKETRFYRITVLVAQFQDAGTEQLRDEICKGLDEFIKEKRNEHMLYYFRGILGLFKQDFMGALGDFDKAINYCDNVVAKYYIGRARCYACLSMFKEAIQDLTVSIEANDSLIEAYILRGKCEFISGDTKKAFTDFQHIIKMRPEDPMMHIHAANILMASGAYEQSIKAYTNAYKLGKIPMALYGRGKCHVAMGNLPQALDDVAKVVDKGYERFVVDLEMLKMLSNLSKIKGTVEENTKVWEQVLAGINKLVSRLDGKPRDEAEATKSENMELANTAIFAQEDLILYRAVIKFYLKDYASALADFQDSYAMMNANSSYMKDGEDDEGQSVDSELSDVGLCSLNKYEYMYNSMLCLLFCKDYEKALNLATNIIDNAGTDYANKMWMLRGAIYQALGRVEDASADFRVMKKHDPEVAKSFLEKKDAVRAEVFPEQNRLCATFPHVKLSLVAGSTAALVRPSFSMPFVKPPGIIPYIDKSILNEFTYKAINCKPEAPWIKRCEHGIKFTDEIRSTIDSVESSTSDQKPHARAVYVDQGRYSKMKEEFSNVKLKSKTQDVLAPSFEFLLGNKQ